MPGTHAAITSRTYSQRMEVVGPSAEIRLTESDQTAPAGRYRLQTRSDVLFLERQRNTPWDEPGAFTDTVVLQFTPGAADTDWGTLEFGLSGFAIGLNGPTLTDNALWRLGADNDQVALSRAATLAADTAITSALLGTTAGSRQALAANSWINSNITASGDYAIYVNNAGVSREAVFIDASARSVMLGHAMTDVRLLATTVLGVGEGLTTAPTGSTFRAPDVATGGAGNIAGADLTIAAGLGTGTGDEGTIIFSLPIVAAAGDNIQTRATRLTLDMAGSTTVLTMSAAQAMTISTATGALGLTSTDGAVNVVTGSGAADDFTVNATQFVVEGDTGNVGIGTVAPGSLLTVAGTSTTGSDYAQTNSALTSGQMMNLTLSGSSVVATSANTGSIASFVSTSTGFSVGPNTLVAIDSSGANANTAFVQQGLVIRVANTGYGTNTALVLNAVGPTASSSAGPIALSIVGGGVSMTSAITANANGGGPTNLLAIGGSLNRSGGVTVQNTNGLVLTSTLQTDNAAGTSIYGVFLNFGTMTNSAGALTATTFADLAITPAAISGTVTNHVGLYITAAPVGGTNPYSIWVDAGTSRFDGNTYLAVDAGNVGINTTAPQSLLDVQGAAGAAGILTLATKELTVVDGDVLGRINFNAPLESAGGDAILVGASIWAEATATFSATVNTTDLVFAVGVSEAAAEKMRLDSAGTLWISSEADSTTAARGIAFGLSKDTNLYRSAADTLRTDDAFISGSTIDATTDFTIGTTVITSDTIVMGTTANLVNTGSTTVNFAGAATTLTIGAAASATTWTGQSIQLTGANSTNNTTLTVTNSSNAAAASHSIVDIAVGGITSTGEPQLRFTIPGGTSWVIGPDNSTSDLLCINTGTVVGPASNTLMTLHSAANVTAGDTLIQFARAPGTYSLASAANAVVNQIVNYQNTVNYTGATTVTSLFEWVKFALPTLAGDTATLTINKATNISVVAPSDGTNVSITDSSAIRVLNTSGLAGAQHGLYIEDMTGGATDYGLTIEGADTACIWVSSVVDTTDAANGIAFGLSRDTNLFRSAAGTLRTERAGQAQFVVSNTGTTGASGFLVYVGAASTTAHAALYFIEGTGTGAADNMSYKFYYDPANNYLAIESRDTDGASADADIIRIPDGQLTVDGNATFDANAFDFVCEQCGYHDIANLTCPRCGHEMVWQDDTKLAFKLSRVVGASQRTGKFDKADAVLLSKMGLLHSYGSADNPEYFIPFQTAHLFEFSAIAQLGGRMESVEDKIQRLEAENETMRNRLAVLEGAKS